MVEALFLDTTTQIDRNWDEAENRQRIREDFEGKRLYCSIYVLKQYKATFLNAAILYYNLLRSSNSIIDALERGEEYKNRDVAGGSLTQRMHARMRKIVYRLTEQHGYSKEAIEKRLKEWIADVWESDFYKGLEQPLIDETRCARADEAPRPNRRGYKPVDVTCNKCNPRDCDIARFWEKYEHHLRTLAEIDPSTFPSRTADRQELRRVKESAQRLLEGESSQGTICSATLSDAVIAIESTAAPEQCVVHTSNLKHLTPLCRAIGTDTYQR